MRKSTGKIREFCQYVKVGTMLLSKVLLLTGHLHLKADPYKMSKSRFNTVEVTELLEQYTANQFRLMCLMEQYYKRTFQIVVPNPFQMKFLSFDFLKLSKTSETTVEGCGSFLSNLDLPPSTLDYQR